MIGGTNCKAVDMLPCEYINVTILSNQPSHEDLIGAAFTVSYGGTIDEYVWEGKERTVKVPADMEYTVSFGAIDGYKSPDDIVNVSVADNSRDIEVMYQTEIVTISVSTDDGVSINPSITIDGILYNGAHKVPYDKTYEIVFGALEGYSQPSTLSYTADSPSREVTGTYMASTLTVNILSNQSNDTVIGAVKATVTYDSTSVEVSNGEKIKIPVNSEVTIAFPAIDGYKAPDAITYTHTDGNAVQSGTYQTEVVRVTLSADDSSDLNGQVITINSVEHTWGGTAVEQKVAFGTEYTVSVSDKDGYTTPASQSYTASEPYRNLAFLYCAHAGTKNPTNGVYIQDTDGYFHTEAEWTGEYNANGIAVITSNCRFVIALEHNKNSYIFGGGDTLVDGCPTFGDREDAIKFYDGEVQTDMIIEGLKNAMSGTTKGAPAAEACRAYTFPNGKKGYLGAAGEWQAVINNKTIIESLLTMCGGDSLLSGSNINKGKLWTNTFTTTALYCWYVDLNTELINNDSRASGKYIRPFCSLE